MNEQTQPQGPVNWLMRELEAQAEFERQQQEQSAVLAQQRRNAQIMQDRQLQEMGKRQEEARMKEAEYIRERQRKLEEEQRARAQEVERQEHDASLARWIAAGNKPADFEPQWKAQYLSIQQERAANLQQSMKEAWLQRHGNPF